MDLHPLVTVVKSLQPDHQRQLLQAVRRLAGGSTLGLRGLVQDQGLLIELDAALFDHLPTAATSADVVVYLDTERDAPSLAALRAELDQWERQAAVAAVAVEEVRANLDLVAKSSAAAVLGRLEPERGRSTNAARLRLDSVRQALGRVEATERTVTAGDAALATLLERWDEYARAADRNRDHLKQLSRHVSVAEGNVDMRRQELEQAQREAEPVVLTAAEEARLEVLADPSIDPTRRGRWKNNLTPEEEEEMRALLAKVGAESWTAYRMLRTAPAVPRVKQEQLQEAEQALAEAEDAAAAARAAHDSDATASQLRQELEEIKDAARPYLGVLVPSDIGTALRDEIKTVENPDWVQAVNDLRDTLASNDLRPPGGLDPDHTIEWTRSWLHQQEDLTADSADGDPQSTADLQAELTERKRTLARHFQALARIEGVEDRAAQSEARLAEFRAKIETWSDRAAVTSAADVMARVEPVVEQIVAETGGAIPVVVIGSMAELSTEEARAALAGLERLAKRAQIIIVTERVDVAQWAVDVGLERAGLCYGVRALI